MDIPGMGQVEDCMDTFKIMPENILKFLGDFKTDSNESGKKVISLELALEVIKLTCPFPVNPFVFNLNSLLYFPGLL